MALTDLNGAAFDPARFAKTFRDTPREALVRLSALHRQAGHDLHLSQFLARAPRFCVALMLAGMLTLIWTFQQGRNASLDPGLATDFIWATSVLTGIVAMTHAHIRSFACNPSPMLLEKAARRLRRLLLYTGLAWGSGAFLVLSPLAGPALAFAVGPSLASILILKDKRGVIGFSAPATLLTATAGLLGTAGPWVAGSVLVAGAALVGFSMLQCARHRASLPDLASL